jgi:hypothetical protein
MSYFLTTSTNAWIGVHGERQDQEPDTTFLCIFLHFSIIAFAYGHGRFLHDIKRYQSQEYLGPLRATWTS